MQATTKTVRKLVRGLYGKSFGYAGSYTDMAKDGSRLVAFRLHNVAEADALAESLQVALFAAGYTNKVKRTSSEGNSMRRAWGGEYVRVRAVL